MIDLENWLTAGDVALRAGVSVQTVRGWSLEGRLTQIKTRHGLLFDPDSVEALIAQRKADRQGGVVRRMRVQ